MKQTAAALLGFTTMTRQAAGAETPCDFKGISVGDRMKPAEIMTALGITKYRTNPVLPFDLALIQKNGIISAAEIQEWKIGPYCDETSCRIPYGVAVGNNNMPVNVHIAFHNDLITEIDVSFSKLYWDEILPILDQKYGADWKFEREPTSIVNFETKKTTVLELISLKHVTNGTNPK